MVSLEPAEIGRPEIGSDASSAGGNAGAMIAEGVSNHAAAELVRPPEPTARRPRRPALASGPAWLLATDGTAVFGLAALLASWRSGLLLAALSVAVLAALGLYRRKLILSVVDDAFRIVAGIAVAWAITVWVAEPVTASRELPAGWLWWLAVAGCVLLARAVTYAVLRRGRARRPEDVVLVGCSPVLIQLADRLSQRPELGLRPIGFVEPQRSAGPQHPTNRTDLPLPVLAAIDALDGILAETGTQHVIVGFDTAPDSDLVEPIRRLRQQGRTVFLVPRLFELSVSCPPPRRWTAFRWSGYRPCRPTGGAGWPSARWMWPARWWPWFSRRRCSWPVPSQCGARPAGTVCCSASSGSASTAGRSRSSSSVR